MTANDLCNQVALTAAVTSTISLPFITADAKGPKHMEVSLSRAKFDSLVEPTLLASLRTCDAVLAAASVRP